MGEEDSKPRVDDDAVIVVKILDKSYDIVNGDVSFKITFLSKDRFSREMASDVSNEVAVGAPSAGPGTLRAAQFLGVQAPSPAAAFGVPDMEREHEQAQRMWWAGNITVTGAALFITGEPALAGSA